MITWPVEYMAQIHKWHYFHSLFSEIFHSVVLYKCFLTGYVKAMLSKSIFHLKGNPWDMSFESFSNARANFRPVGSFARFAIFVIIDPLLRTSLALPDFSLIKGPLLTTYYINNLLHLGRIIAKFVIFSLFAIFVKFATFQGATLGIPTWIFVKPMIDFLPDSPFLSDSPFRQFFVFARSAPSNLINIFASPLAIFRHWWLLSLFSSYSPFSSWSPLSKRPLLSFNLNVFQTHGEFCQIRHFRQPLHFVRSTFITSFKFSSAVWRFFAKFAIFAIAYISGHISKVTILDIIHIPFH